MAVCRVDERTGERWSGIGVGVGRALGGRRVIGRGAGRCGGVSEVSGRCVGKNKGPARLPTLAFGEYVSVGSARRQPSVLVCRRPVARARLPPVCRSPGASAAGSAPLAGRLPVALHGPLDEAHLHPPVGVQLHGRQVELHLALPPLPREVALRGPQEGAELGRRGGRLGRSEASRRGASSPPRSGAPPRGAPRCRARSGPSAS